MYYIYNFYNDNSHKKIRCLYRKTILRYSHRLTTRIFIIIILVFWACHHLNISWILVFNIIQSFHILKGILGG